MEYGIHGEMGAEGYEGRTVGVCVEGGVVCTGLRCEEACNLQ